MNRIARNMNRIARNLIPCLSVLFLCLSVAVAKAQTTLPLTVAPARQTLSVNPGEETAVLIKFYNHAETPVQGFLKVADFVVEDKEGTPKFLDEEEYTVIGKQEISSRFAASSWFELPYERMTIGAKDSVLIQAKIRVPIDARPGGRYVAVYFESATAASQALGAPREAEVPTAARIAGLVYLRVAGPITEAALLTKFVAPSYSEYGPVKIESEILNRGDYHIRPKGVITVTDFLGRLVGQSVLKEQNIFPDSSRLYENTLGKKWMFGRFRADLSAVYGETSAKALTGTVYFWVFPWKETTVVVLAFVILALLITGLHRRTTEKEKEMEEELKEKEKELKELKEELKKKESE